MVGEQGRKRLHEDLRHRTLAPEGGGRRAWDEQQGPLLGPGSRVGGGDCGRALPQR